MDKLTGIISSAELLGGQIVGMRGLEGDKGDKGDTGESATIAVGTVTTGDAGTSATVTNIGDNHDAVFDFTIPKGDKGDTGATGDVNTYIAEYGTATYADIGDAITEGKYVIAEKDNNYYPLVMFSNSSYVFSYIHENICYEVVCDSYSTWTARTHTSVRDVKQNGASVTTSGVALVTVPTATSTTPKMDGTASAGSETTWAKGDHIHPSDTSKADVGHTHTKSDVTDFTHTHTKSDITDFPTLATVATSGDYDDLTDKPSIHNVPSGGTKGQVLTKDSSTDYDASWANPEVTLATLESLMPTDTASGAIASFPDGQNVFPLKSLVADIDPIQDLHGYDKPWVGGAGKNKFHFSAGRSAYTWNDGFGFSAINVDDDGVTLNGTATSAHSFSVTGATLTLASGTYRVTTQSLNVGLTVLNGSTVIATGYGGSGMSFTLSEQTEVGFSITCANGASFNNQFVGFQIEEGATASAWTPYSNICPISGHTEVDVVVSPTTNAADGNTYTTALGRTVYGGTLDLVSGELTVTHLFFNENTADMNNNEAYPGWLGHPELYNVVAQGSQASFDDLMGNIGKYASFNNLGTGLLFLPTNRYGGLTQSEWKAMALDVQFVLPLITPLTYQLSPQQIQTLLGTNNIWADSGDVEVIYKADIQKWVEKKTDELNTAILALA